MCTVYSNIEVLQIEMDCEINVENEEYDRHNLFLMNSYLQPRKRTVFIRQN